MTGEPTVLFFEKDVRAPIKDCYRAFTNQALLEEWLCNSANVDVSLLSKLYMWWNNGYYMVGEFTKVDLDKEIVFTWLGKNDPGRTRVRVTFKPGKSATHITIEHRGFKNTPRWSKAAANIQHGWEPALENLASILETGADLRIVSRPMLGINMDEFTPEIASRLRVPVIHGVRLGGVVDGMGAQKCGLQKDDVIIEAAGVPMLGHTSLSSVLQGKKAGDKVDVIYYRGPEKISVSMTLSPRPIPNIPSSMAELALAVSDIYARGDDAIARSLEGVTDAESSFKPAPDEWSVREVLAHLIHNERDVQFMMHKVMVFEDLIFPSNLQTRIDATVAIYSTLADLRLELQRAEGETIAFIRCIPDEFTTRKNSFWILGYNLLQADYHPFEHAKQIEDVVKACRSK
jgi:uncharacterized protein YndB with AHSA1/START domain